MWQHIAPPNSTIATINSLARTHHLITAATCQHSAKIKVQNIPKFGLQIADMSFHEYPPEIPRVRLIALGMQTFDNRYSVWMSRRTLEDELVSKNHITNTDICQHV